MKTILITGGAGFIGSHVADELLQAGYRVRVLDCLEEQVHGVSQERPEYLDPRAEFICGDVRDKNAVTRALEGVDGIVHLAAAVGVGQSMYEIVKYTEINNMGTAALMEAILDRPIRKLVVASSMSIYGEGAYEDASGQVHRPQDRHAEDLEAGRWDPLVEGKALRPVPIAESARPEPSSVYALGKLDQERMCLIVGKAYDIPTTALRFFNVYGPRQALSNPYTGVLAIFASRFLNDRAPLIFEDGEQRRDFVHVTDIARAIRLSLESEHADGQVYNVGSGVPRTINSVARDLGRVLNKPDLKPEVTGRFRKGDVRHCFADITKAQEELGYEPQVSFEDGLRELAGWLRDQIATDHVEAATQELKKRGLAV